MRTVRSLIGLIAVGLVVCVVEAFNAMYGSSFGQGGIEAAILGGAAFGIGLFKACGPFYLQEAWQERQPVRWLLIAAVFLLCIGFSHSSSVGIIAERRLDRAAERSAAAESREVLSQRIAEAKDDLKKVEWARPEGVVKAEIAAFAKDFSITWQDRNEKTLKLRMESEAAKSREAAKQALATFRNKLDGLTGVTADPQASILARLYGGATQDWQTGLVYLVSWLLEIISAFGLYMVFGRHKRVPAPINPASAEEVSAVAVEIAGADEDEVPIAANSNVAGAKILQHPQFKQFLAFEEEALVPDGAGEVGAVELYHAYKAWCADKNEMPVSNNIAGQMFGYMFAKDTDGSGKRRYFGIRLADDRRLGKLRPDPPVKQTA